MTPRYLARRHRWPRRPADPERSRERALAFMLFAVHLARIAGEAAGKAIAAAKNAGPRSDGATLPGAGQELLNVVQAATLLGISEKALRHRIERGLLPPVRVGRSVRVRRRDLVALMAEGRGPSPRSR